MKCAQHKTEAIGLCAYCGRAVCAECSHPTNGRRLVCSEACDTALVRNDRAIDAILHKSAQSARASAFFSYMCGILSAGGAVAAAIWLPVPFLIWFTAGCAFVFLVSGWWYGRVAKKQIL